MRISEDLGVRWPLPAYQVYLAFERFIAGEWDDAIAELEASLALAEETGEIYSRVYAYGVLSLISLHRNDLSRAREAAAAAARDLAGWSPGYQHELGRVAAGPHPGGRRRARRRRWPPWPASGTGAPAPGSRWNTRRSEPISSGSPWPRAIPERAREVSAAVAEMASGNEVPWMTGAALRCQGLVENDAEILQAAAAAYARGSRPLGLALACEDAGAAFARRGQRGPRPPAARSGDRHLRAARRRARPGARRGGAARGGHPARPPGPPRAGRNSAGTASPRPSARSPAWSPRACPIRRSASACTYHGRTVQTHLAHVFAKLDITSRAQLAAEVSRHRSSKPADVAGSAGE